MVVWNLSQIITKVRALTGTPSVDQLTDAQITDYVNTYYTFTMPFELKEQINLQPLNFNTLPNIDVYSFPGAFLTDQPMAYADGFPLIFYQDRDIFFQDWPQQFASDNVATGNGGATYTGSTQSFPIIAGTFIITDGVQIVEDIGITALSEVIATGNGVATSFAGILTTFPLIAGSVVITDTVEIFTDNGLGGLVGNLGGIGAVNYVSGAWSVSFNTAVANTQVITANYNVPIGNGSLSGDGTGTIDYVTGVFSVTFNAVVPVTRTIYDKYQAYQPARPQGVLFYNNEFTFRPIPDQVYEITLQGYINQIQLSGGQSPLQSEWGQLIAYGASLEIFSDRGDLGNYNAYYPIMKRYENVALARFVQQLEAAQSVPRF